MMGMNLKLGLLALGVLLFSCKQDKTTKQQEAPVNENFPRKQTLYVGGWDWSAPSTFNPLDADPNFPMDGNVNLVYEALFGYNQISGKLEPILAQNYTESDSSIIVELDPQALWSDGTPVRAEDVVFTFELDRDFETTRHSNWNFLKTVKAQDSLKIIFQFNPERYNPLSVKDMISEVNILPRSVFSPLVDSAEGNLQKLLNFKNDKNIVASGPYTLHSYSQEQIVLKRNDSYWGKYKYENKLPEPLYIIHSLYQGNNHFSHAMTKGQLDLSSTYMPRIWTKKKDKVRAWDTEEPYHSPGSIPTLFMPLQKKPFSDVKFRRALAHSVNYERIRNLAVSKYTPSVKPGFILPFGPESKYYSQEDAGKYGYSYNLETARDILKQAGYQWNEKGELQYPDGSLLPPLSLECPQGWTDWENTLNIVRDDLKSLGIDAQKKFVPYGKWDEDVKKGTFDLIMKTQTANLWPSTPWKRFDQVMNSDSTLFKPVGEEMHHNFGRYRNEKVQKLLRAIPSLQKEEEIAKAYRELNRIFMEEIPVLTLMYRPTSFYQFSEQHWKGFPAAENQAHSTPQCLMIGAGIKDLWKLRSVP
jgi:peptide/nickel transport system substrate-binding protein